MEVPGAVAEKHHVARGRREPVMVSVRDEVFDGFGARLTESELLEDGVDGNGPSEQSLSGPLVEDSRGWATSRESRMPCCPMRST